MGKQKKPEAFLSRLGAHCQRLREQRGYSIDRLAKESDGLSTSVIHGLEKGTRAVTVAALYRVAEVLEVEVRELFDFEASASGPKPLRLISSSDPRVAAEAFRTLLPLFSLEAAAGSFGEGRSVEPLGWVEAKGRTKLDKQMFVAKAVGHSMMPKIKNGDYLLFRANPEGTRQGRIVLAEARGLADPETGGSYTVKLYHSTLVRELGREPFKEITLSPLNPDYEPIRLKPSHEGDFRILAELVLVLD